MSEYSGYSTGYISMVSAGGGLQPLASQFVTGAYTTTTNASTTAATANTSNALESTTGTVANVWA